PQSCNPTLTLDPPATYGLARQVSHDRFISLPDHIINDTENSAPVARAGADAQFPQGTTVVLDGRGSRDPDGDPLFYRWRVVERPAGSESALDDPRSAQPRLVLDAPGSYTLSLVVDDDELSSEPDQLRLDTTIRWPEARTGGDRVVAIGAGVVLDGQASTAEVPPLSYRWQLLETPEGSTATLDDPERVDPAFVADVAGAFVAQLVVVDGLGLESEPVTVDIEAVSAEALAAGTTSPGQTPKAALSHRGVFAPRAAQANDEVVLKSSSNTAPPLQVIVCDIPAPLTLQEGFDGYTGSRDSYLSGQGFYDGFRPQVNENYGADPTLTERVPLRTPLIRFALFDDEGGPLSRGVDPEAITATLSLYKAGNYDYEYALHRLRRPFEELEVTWLEARLSDPWSEAGAKSITGDYVPEADATGSVGFNPQWLTLDVTASVQAWLAGDPNYGWRLQGVRGNGNFKTFNSRTFGGANPSAEDQALRPKLTLTFECTYPPVAHAGGDRVSEVDQTINLDGTGSLRSWRDTPLSYQWRLATPPGSTASLDDATRPTPSFVADVAGVYLLTLVVSDGQTVSEPDVMEVIAGPVTVIDNTSSAFSLTGDWTLDNTVEGFFATDYYQATTPSAGATAVWSLANVPSGTYRVYVRQLATSSAYAYTVDHTQGSQVTRGAQSSALGIWQWLNTFTLDAASRVTLTTSASASYYADAVLLAPAGDTTPPSFPPTITWLSPEAGATVVMGTPVTLTAAAADPDSEVENVRFTADGVFIATDNTTDAPTHSVTWTPTTAGAVVLEARVSTLSLTPSGAPVTSRAFRSATRTVTVRDPSVNVPPTAIAGPDQTVAVDALVTLDGSGSSDLNGDPLTYQWSLVGPAGSTATLDAATQAKPLFQPDGVGSYTATLVVNDGLVDSVADSVTITVNPIIILDNSDPAFAVTGTWAVSNQRPGFIGADYREHGADASGDTATWALASVPAGRYTLYARWPSWQGGDSRSSVAPYRVEHLAGTTEVILNQREGQEFWQPLGVFDLDAASQVVLTAVPDGTLIADALQLVPVGVVANVPPTVSFTAPAPGAELPVNQAVTLSATAADGDGSVVDVAFYANGTLLGNDTTAPYSLSWTPTAVGGVDLEARATDDAGATVGALRTVTVVNPTVNTPPVADAGADQSQTVGSAVSLDGLGSFDDDDDTLSYLWTLTPPAGSAATLDDPTDPTPQFTADVTGTYTASLVVNDGQADSAVDEVVITVLSGPDPTPPTANAGPDQTVTVGTQVTLDGTGSAPGNPGGPLSYSWTLSVPVGSTAALDDATGATPQFTADVAGTYTASLVVNDTQADSTADSVVITAQADPDPTAPTAEAGPDQTAAVGALVTLDGRTSSLGSGSGPLTYLWSLDRPVGSSATLDDPTLAMPQFTPDVEGVYTATLVVNDGQGDSLPDSVTITTPNAANTAPVANAGLPQKVFMGDKVYLDASASTDADGDALTYRWALVSSPPNSLATLSNPDVLLPSFEVDEAGAYQWVLTVSDGIANSTDTVIVTTGDAPPVARAGNDATAPENTDLFLDGGLSFDVEGLPLSYRWQILDEPTPGAGTLSDATSAMPRLAVTVSGAYTVELVVNDGTSDSKPDVVVIRTDNSPPTPVITLPTPLGALGTPVTLDAGASVDPDNDPIAYRWDVLYQPTGSLAVLSDPTGLTTTLTPDVPGVYVVQLITTPATGGGGGGATLPAQATFAALGGGMGGASP
ncbi:MAG: PKD domain-containing protein, partial [Candidatus Competibacterales bacterium]